MNKIIKFDENSSILTCEAGCVLDGIKIINLRCE
jgi:FAD/FMN-containing dehydrogenase